MSEITSIILAAGEGTRMRSKLPKVLHPLCGQPLIDYSLKVSRQVGARKIIVVTPPRDSNPVAQHLKEFAGVKVVAQKKPLGTADAVLSCQRSLNGTKGNVVILYGDNPLLRPETLQEFIKTVRQADATLGFVTTRFPNPAGYGRVVRDRSGEVVKIVEEKECTPQEKEVREINAGIYCVKADWLLPVLKKLKPHPITKEYYLTDIVEQALAEKQKLLGFFCENAEEFLGVNTPAHLLRANEIMCHRLVVHWMERGVAFLDGRHVYLEPTVVIGRGTVIHPQVYLQGKTKIGRNCVIECGSILRDIVLADGVHIKPYSILEESRIEKEAVIGPFARIRPGSVVGAQSRVGNFVELKKTRLGKGVKANHLTYLGDAVIGDETNVGCGTITCNYDGVKKHPTKIGRKVFIGSDVQFVAPVKIGDGAYIGAGSTITEDVPSQALAVARGRQVNKKNWVKKKLERK